MLHLTGKISLLIGLSLFGSPSLGSDGSDENCDPGGCSLQEWVPYKNGQALSWRAYKKEQNPSFKFLESLDIENPPLPALTSSPVNIKESCVGRGNDCYTEQFIQLCQGFSKTTTRKACGDILHKLQNNIENSSQKASVQLFEGQKKFYLRTGIENMSTLLNKCFIHAPFHADTCADEILKLKNVKLKTMEMCAFKKSDEESKTKWWPLNKSKKETSSKNEYNESHFFVECLKTANHMNSQSIDIKYCNYESVGARKKIFEENKGICLSALALEKSQSMKGEIVITCVHSFGMDNISRQRQCFKNYIYLANEVHKSVYGYTCTYPTINLENTPASEETRKEANGELEGEEEEKEEEIKKQILEQAKKENKCLEKIVHSPQSNNIYIKSLSICRSSIEEKRGQHISLNDPEFQSCFSSSINKTFDPITRAYASCTSLKLKKNTQDLTATPTPDSIVFNQDCFSKEFEKYLSKRLKSQHSKIPQNTMTAEDLLPPKKKTFSLDNPQNFRSFVKETCIKVKPTGWPSDPTTDQYIEFLNSINFCLRNRLFSDRKQRYFPHIKNPHLKFRAESFRK